MLLESMIASGANIFIWIVMILVGFATAVSILDIAGSKKKN